MADEHKQRGNEAFASKRFAEAIQHYDLGIQADPKNIDLYNNRAAANHALGNYKEAIEDGRRSNKISSNSKAHTRVGDAQWCLGKWTDARDAYELALVLAPANQAIRDKLTQVRKIIEGQTSRSTNSSGSGPVGVSKAGFMLNVATISFAVLHLIFMFLNGTLAMFCWSAVLASFTARQLLILKASNMLSPSLPVLKSWLLNFSGLYTILCVTGILTRIQPLPLLLACIVVYSLVDVTAQFKHYRLETVVPPALWAKVEPQLTKAAASRDILLANAATCEALMLFMLFFTSSSSIFTFLFVQFVKFRYRSDVFVQQAFSSIRRTIEVGTKHRLAPPVVDRVFAKSCDFLHRVGTQ